jgi:hypothetical protein
MLRFILIVFILAVLFVGGAAVLLHYFFGWPGLLAFPFLLLAALWGVKLVVGHLFKRLALGLFGLKSGVLRGARLEVHSVTPITKPVEIEIETQSDAVAPDATNGGPSARGNRKSNRPGRRKLTLWWT